jgi:hypothetical protein
MSIEINLKENYNIKNGCYHGYEKWSFTVCTYVFISSASERKHEIACTSWSSCLWKLCELVSNIEEQLCIVFIYTGNLSIISTISQFEGDSKMCTFHLIWSAFVYDVWTTDLGFCQVCLLTHGKVKNIAISSDPNSPYTARHGFISLSFTIFVHDLWLG